MINRLASIDVLRALTMFLMIFVNDVAGVRHIPDWIKHAGIDESFLGFSDVIFPAFLFIVGLSLPLALQRKIAQGNTQTQVLGYISTRAIALIIMGLFHVNFSYYNESLALLPRSMFIILSTVCFFLVWLAYPASIPKSRQQILKIIGLIGLALLALSYKGGTTEQPRWMQIHWWGILGLIGWAYWVVGLVYVFLKDRLAWLVLFFGVLSLINIGVHLEWIQLPKLFVGDTAHHILVAGGMLCTLFYLRFKGTPSPFWLWLCGAGVLLLLFGWWISGQTDGINKIRATPGWVHLSMGISLICYALSIYWVDLKKKENTLAWIAPAGTNTLTCYLLPYVWYACFRMLEVSYPAFLQEGIGGILRSLAVAGLIVALGGWLEKKQIRIKV